MTYIRKRRSLHFLRWLIIAIILILISFGAFLAYKATHHTVIEPVMTGSSSTKGEPITHTSNTSVGTTNIGSSPQPGDNKNNGGTAAPTKLLAPSGNFVSNHHPNLSGSPAPSTITSVCTTTPGGMCQITFSKNGVTKTLPSQMTDRGGSTYWNDWSLQTYQLTAGSWQVTATASLNGQTQSTTDALMLEVSQ